MKPPRVRNSLLAAVIAASGATAWAAYELNGTLVPGPAPLERPTAVEAPPAPPQPVVVDAEAALLPNETMVITDSQEATVKEMEARPAPAAVYDRVEPSIEITKPRLTVDQRIQADVMDHLARNPNLSGKIGVVTDAQVVTLTGYVATSGQAWRAGRDVGRVEGVRQVVNEIRPRVGGITS
jgi:hypothetical protein